MKKLTLLFIACSGLLFGQNQDYIVTDRDNVPYENNSLHIFNVHGTFDDPIEEAKIYYVVHNQSSTDIRVFGQIVEITNTDGNSAQFCFGGNCYFPLEVGGLYPVNGVVIAPGSFQGIHDYFINLDETNLVEYKFRFYQADGSGTEIPNTSFYMTYRYDENMAVSDVASIAIAEVAPTVVKGYTNVSLKEKAAVSIVNMEGKVVKTFSLNSGSSRVDLSGLSSGVYMMSFKGESGTTTTKKIVVK